MFHKDCLEGWKNQEKDASDTCPICRGDLVPLITAIKDRNTAEVEELIRNNRGIVNQADCKGISPLMMAIFDYDVPMVKILLKEGGNII